MAVTITRSIWIDDDGTGTTGTVINQALHTTLYNEIDAALAQLIPATGPGAGLIPFPATQNPSSNPNTLDDYEEGTWTPVLGGTTGTSGQTYSVQLGSYVKIGQLVVAAFNLTLTAKGTITGNIVLQGLPFFPGPNSMGIASIGFNLLATSWTALILNLSNNNANVYITGVAAAGTSNVGTILAPADISNSTSLQGTLSYRAAQ